MKTLTELYTLLKKRIESRIHAFWLCNNVTRLDLTTKEENKLLKHLHKNKPTAILHKEFYKHISFNGSIAWWDSEKYEQRLLFLDKMIKITNRKKNDSNIHK